MGYRFFSFEVSGTGACPSCFILFSFLLVLFISHLLPFVSHLQEGLLRCPVIFWPHPHFRMRTKAALSALTHCPDRVCCIVGIISPTPTAPSTGAFHFLIVFVFLIISFLRQKTCVWLSKTGSKNVTFSIQLTLPSGFLWVTLPCPARSAVRG